MQKTARREPVAQLADEPVGEITLLRPDGIGIPLRRFEIVDRHEGRLATHRQPNIALKKGSIHLFAERIERRPRLVGKRLRDARMFRDARNLHVEAKIHLGIARTTRNRRGVAIMRRRGQRNVALARQEPRGRIEADPPCPWQIDLDPGMEIGEIMVGARRPVERDEVGLQLDQIAGHEARREPQMAQRLDQQPA
jgi:hypothetical protein